VSKNLRLLVDDSDANVEEFHDAGGMTHLVPRHWNRAHALADRTLAALGIVNDITLQTVREVYKS